MRNRLLPLTFCLTAAAALALAAQVDEPEPALQFGIKVQQDIDATMAYTEVDKAGLCSLWVIGPGHNPRTLVSGDVDVARRRKVDGGALRWSPDASRIAFISTAKEGSHELYIGTPQGGAPELAARNLGAGAIDFDWDPTGNFISLWLGNGDRRLCYLLVPATGKLWEVTGGAPGYRPAWSSARPRLAFAAPHERGSGVFVASAETEGPAAFVASAKKLSGRIWWSPLGDAVLAEEVDDLGRPAGLVYAEPGKPGAASSIAEGARHPEFADWSPDGRHIAFAGETGEGTHALYVSTAPFAGAPAVIAGGPDSGMSVEVAGEDFGWAQWGQFSPDGSRIAYVAGPTETIKQNWLYSAAPDGSDVRSLSEPVECRGYRWSPTGRAIGFAGRRGSRGRLSVNIYAVPVDEAQPTPRRLAPNIGHFAWSPDARYISYVTFDIYDRNHQLLQVVEPATLDMKRVADAMEEYAWAPAP